MELKDHLAILREQYKQECDDNSELFRRGNFMYVLIAALGALSLKLAFSVKTSADLSMDARMWTCGAVLVTLVISAYFLVRALAMGDWTTPKLKELESAERGQSIELTPDDVLLREYARAVNDNRDSNWDRFAWLQKSFVATTVAAGLVLIQCGAHAMYGRHAISTRADSAKGATAQNMTTPELTGSQP